MAIVNIRLLGKKEKDKEIKRARKIAKKLGIPKDVKSKCCDKYKKGESKRCGRCPCFDLIKKAAA